MRHELSDLKRDIGVQNAAGLNKEDRRLLAGSKLTASK